MCGKQNNIYDFLVFFFGLKWLSMADKSEYRL